MARSKKKTPICGMTTADSDKPFKAAEHRRERRSVRRALDGGADVPSPLQFGNPWASEKDGKHWFDRQGFPELMRK
ncbi:MULTISPECIES: hypothetical protein [unclassified Mesorhizobium]|uniref:hypothetical protein n=1 Tax=unclassified Mesorhizobium TaxID=325217 RepID=UPI003014ECB7